MKDYQNRVGEKYITNEGYEIEIIEYFSFTNCTIRFSDTRNTILKNIDYGNIKKGGIRNPYHPSVCKVGYIGEGKYRVRINGILSFGYESWRDMLRRCYSKERQIIQPTYQNCSVLEEWKCFQNFAQWYERNFNPETMKGYHLDKDILVKGNKVYSPETCCFVPREINALFIKRQNRRGEYPVGVHINKLTNRYVALINKGSKQEWINSYKTPEEAFQAYKTAKEKYIKEVADKWKDQIDPRVYEALYNYEVEITD